MHTRVHLFCSRNLVIHNGVKYLCNVYIEKQVDEFSYLLYNDGVQFDHGIQPKAESEVTKRYDKITGSLISINV